MVNLNSLVDEKPRVKKTAQPHVYKHLFGNSYVCTSGNSGIEYKLTVEENLVFYTCSCPGYCFNLHCDHGKQLCERLADGESFDKPVQPWRVTSNSPFEFDNAPLLDSNPAKRKPTLEELITY